MEQESQLLASDTACEQALIGTLMQYDCIDEVRQYLSEDCFTNPTHREVYRACVVVANNNQEVNFVNVNTELRRSGIEIPVTEVIDYPNHAARTALEAPHFALRLQNLAVRRKAWKIGQRLVENGTKETEDIAEVAQRAADELNSLNMPDNEGVSTLQDAIQGLNEQMKRNAASSGGVTGTETGFRKLNEKGGLQGSDLIIIAGETSQGKTTFALSITRKAIEKHKVAFYSLEMTKEQLAARLVSAESGVPANELLYSSSLTEQQLAQYDAAIGRLQMGNLLFDDRSTSNLDTILASIRKLKREQNMHGAVVDYLQILGINASIKGASKEQLIAEAARRLKNLAKELNIWIIALSQLNRNSQDPVPNLNRLRDSGQIAEAADVVMFVYRPEYYNKQFPEPFSSTDPLNKAMIDVAKGRNIGIFRFLVDFNKASASFSDAQNDALVIGGDTPLPPPQYRQGELPF